MVPVSPALPAADFDPEMSASMPARGTERMAFPSDMNDAEWERVRLLLPVEGRIGRRRQNMRRVLDGIFYIVEHGERWRMMPEQFPAWQTCYRWRRRLMDQGVWSDLIAVIGRCDRLEQCGHSM